MIKSQDGLLSIQVVSTDKVWEVPLSKADVYVFNVPVKTEDAKLLLKRINESASMDSVTLLTFRHNKAEVVKAIANVADLSEFKNLIFGDTVLLSYQTTSKRGSLSKLGEIGVILSKGIASPTWDQTSWYREDAANASNFWDLTPYDHDVKEPVSRTTYGQFAWDLGLLTLCLVHPPRHRKLVWGNPPDTNLLAFAKTFNVQVDCFVHKIEEANELLKKYEEIQND